MCNVILGHTNNQVVPEEPSTKLCVPQGRIKNKYLIILFSAGKIFCLFLNI